MFTSEHKIYAASCAIAFDNLHEASRRFKKKYPGMQAPQPVEISRWKEKLWSTGSIHGIKQGRGRKPEATSSEKSEEVFEALKSDPLTSIRQISMETNTSKSSVHRIIKKSGYRPWKVESVQELYDGDDDRRLEFCSFVMEKLETDDSFHHKILFSDEAMFHLDGTVNKHNLHYYSIENPHMGFPQSVKTKGLTVWAMIGYNGLCALDISHETMNGARYLSILEDKVYPYLCHRKQLIFQQDGAPAHFQRSVREFLDEKLPKRWLGRRGSLCEFPPRSPDLTACDYWLWGYVKNRVYAQGKFSSLQHLEAVVRSEMEAIPKKMFQNSVDNFKCRCIACIENQGYYFE
jgi:hypothetical protein